MFSSDESERILELPRLKIKKHFAIFRYASYVILHLLLLLFMHIEILLIYIIFVQCQKLEINEDGQMD